MTTITAEAFAKNVERYLKDTYGITVYQEQVMLLSREIADFTRGESDGLRKAMGKKLADKMAELKVKFLAGGKKKGYKEEILEKIWADWAKFASYAFNKSHATCYSWVAYQTAYLKANYPAEYMAGALSRNLNNIAEIIKLMDECRTMGIRVLTPDINESDFKFSVNQDGNIRFGLNAIKGVGSSAVEMIIREREENGPFENVYDFSIGNPFAEPPVDLRERMKELVDQPGVHRYMPNAGFPDVREKVAAFYSARSEKPIPASHIVMTTGAAGALNVLFTAILNPGEPGRISIQGHQVLPQVGSDVGGQNAQLAGAPGARASLHSQSAHSSGLSPFLFCAFIRLSFSRAARIRLGRSSAPLSGAAGRSHLTSRDPIRPHTSRAALGDRAAGAQRPDLLVVNPPRRGIGERLAGRIEASGVERVLYSSCNPRTLAADLARLPSMRVVRSRLFDMFPHTDHAEVLVELVRG